jgi:hypothetical protein
VLQKRTDKSSQALGEDVGEQLVRRCGDASCGDVRVQDGEGGYVNLVPTTTNGLYELHKPVLVEGVWTGGCAVQGVVRQCAHPECGDVQIQDGEGGEHVNLVVREERENGHRPAPSQSCCSRPACLYGGGGAAAAAAAMGRMHVGGR